MNKFLTLIGILISIVSCNYYPKPLSQNVKDSIVNTSIDSLSNKFLSERSLIEYKKNSPTFVCDKNFPSPFDSLNYDKVIAYDYEGSEEPYGSIIIQNKYVPVVLKQKALDKNEVNSLIQTLTNNSTYGDITAACFQPHLGIVFYKADSVVNIVDVCLSCNYLISTNDISAMHKTKVNAGTPNEYSAIGFSKIGKAKIKVLCKKIGFFYGN
jgi:hypothetical protein